MPESFNAVQLMRYLARNWAVLASAVAAAAILALIVSVLMPNLYTAEARLLIEPPTGSDPRSALVISPVYVDSLKTYALMATSDELFSQAVEAVGVRGAGKPLPLSTLKASVLEVEIERNSMILSIRATLQDPEKAQALALYLAEATLQRNQEIRSAGGQFRAGAAEQSRDAAAQQVAEIEKQLFTASRKRPLAGLETEVETLTSNRESLRDELRLSQRSQHELLQSQGSKQRADPFAARIAQIHSEIERIDKELPKKTVQLAATAAAHEALADRLEAARGLLGQAEERLANERTIQSTRGERLQILDRGVVPDRPSSPRKALNVIVASALALVLSVLFVTLRFSIAQASPPRD